MQILRTRYGWCYCDDRGAYGINARDPSSFLRVVLKDPNRDSSLYPAPRPNPSSQTCSSHTNILFSSTFSSSSFLFLYKLPSDFKDLVIIRFPRGWVSCMISGRSGSGSFLLPWRQRHTLPSGIISLALLARMKIP